MVGVKYLQAGGWGVGGGRWVEIVNKKFTNWGKFLKLLWNGFEDTLPLVIGYSLLTETGLTTLILEQQNLPALVQPGGAARNN